MIDWTSDSDPSVRGQVLAYLTGADVLAVPYRATVRFARERDARAVEVRQLEHPSQREGLAVLTLRSDDLEVDVARLRTAGVRVTSSVHDEITDGGSTVGPRGLEPRTSSLSGMRSNRAELWALTGSQGSTILPGSPAERKAARVDLVTFPSRIDCKYAPSWSTVVL